MGNSMSPQLLDKFHDLLKGCETDAEVLHYLDSSYSSLRCNMRRVRFVKTFLFYRDARWNGQFMHLASLFDETISCLCIFESQIQQVLECWSVRYLAHLLLDSFPTISLLRKKIEIIYRRLKNTPNPVKFVDVDVFDGFTVSVQEYLMNVPAKPIGWVNFASDYSEVEANYGATRQQLECFRYMVRDISKQCTDKKKLQTLLARAASLLFDILHMANTNDVYRIFTRNMQENIIGCSFDMSQQKLSPHNPDAEELYLEGLLAKVKIIMASKPSLARFRLMPKSFFNLLQSVQNQVQLLGEILELPIMDLESNRQVEIWFRRGYVVLVREALSRSPFSLNPYRFSFSNWLHKLELIKDQLFVLELHNYKSSLISLGSLATVRGACKCLSLFFKTPRVHLEGIENLILALTEFSLRGISSFQNSSFSEDVILESSFSIFKLFKAEATVMVLTHSDSSLKFLSEFRTTTPQKLASTSASFMRIMNMNQSSRRLMKVSVSVTLLLDKLDEFLNKCPSFLWTYIRSTRRGIKFVKTILFYYDAHDWSGLEESEHFAYLWEDTETYFKWLACEITKVFEYEDHRQDSALTQSFVTVHLVCIKVGEMYDELKKVRPPAAFFVDSVVFDEFADSVQQYLMNIPREPLGWGRSSHDYSKVEGNYKDTVQRLERFRYMVRSFSNQCTDQKKLQTLLDSSTAMVVSMLHMAHRIDARRTRTIEEEDNILRSSYDMASRFSPQNQDTMKLYLEVLSAKVKASKKSSEPYLWMKSFCKFLQSVQNQVHSLGHILDFPIKYIIDDNMGNEQVESFLKQYSVIMGEVGSICSSIPNPNHVVSSNLLRKLNLIKAELFVLVLHNYRSRLTYVGKNRAVLMKEAFMLLIQFFTTPEVHMEGIEKLILVLIEAFLREAGSLCGTHERKQFLEAMIVKSSHAILKLLKADALLILLNHDASCLNFFVEFHIETLHKSLLFLRESLLDPTLDSLKDANISTVCETLAAKAASFVCLSEDHNREMDQLMPISQMPCQVPWLVFTNFPKNDGVVFVEPILGKLRKLVSDKPDTYAFMKVEIDSLLKALDFFMPFLKDVKREDSKNKDLELRVTCLMYNAEYIIELLLCRDVPLCYLELVIFIIVEESKVLEVQILDNRHDDDSLKVPLQDVRLTLACETSEDSNLRTEEVIVGLDDQAKDVIDQLQSGSEHLQVVSIIGMAGVGKTTLAKKVCTIFSIKYHFAACARCHVSPFYRKRELLLEILGDLVAITDYINKRDDNDLALLIKQKLRGKRYLIVVDDVWSIEHWDDLKLSFPDDNKGSRILITTRDHVVARKAGHDREPYVLHLLSPPQSWDLLRAKLFQGGECPEQLLEAGKLVIEHCRGLPLAIVVIAGILKRTQMKKHQWGEIAKHLRSRIAYDQEIHFTDILEFSYNYLPSYLKPCYLYLGSFLEDQEIPVNKLLWLWMAEGFVPKLDHKSLEETAEGYLVELINRSLVMETKRNSLGGTKACRIHDMLRDLCLKKAKEENFMQLISMNGSSNSDPISSDSRIGKGYRLCVHSPKQNFIHLSPSAPHVHSLLFFDTDNTLDNKSYDISSIFQNFKFLRVLDVEPITASTFPTGAYFLHGLSYLAISGNIKSVPSSISKLWNLETLIVKGTRGDIALPSSLWSMEMLRHVHVRPKASLTLSSHEHENIMVLEKLTTLSSPVLPDRKVAEEKILKRWIRLKKLRCIFMEQWDSSRKCNVFPSFELFSKLESLNIYNGGRSIPAELTFPLNLKKLTLSRFCLPWNYISVISQLSNLVVLRLLFRAFDGDTWEMIGEIFPKLRVLKLENLNLVNWNNTLDCVDHFPELETLVLRNCKKLGEVPSSFGEVLSLKMIEVNWCSQSAAKSMETIMDQQLDFDNRDFQLMITPSEWDFRTSP